MFCHKCGKQIPDQANFCNYCGTPMTPTQPKTTPVTQSEPKKKGGAGRTILTIVIILAVYFGAKAITKGFISSVNNNSGSNGSNKTSISQSQNDNYTSENTAVDSAVEDAMNSCLYGAIYENGYLRYGMTRLYAPNYSLLDGEGDERDWLMSSDGGALLATYRQLEIPNISYTASTEEVMLDSYKNAYGDATMIEYEKLYVDGFPVIRYIVGYATEGAYQYQGELIVFPSEVANKTIRLTMFVDAASSLSTSDITAVLNTLEVSADFGVKTGEAPILGLNGITVK